MAQSQAFRWHKRQIGTAQMLTPDNPNAPREPGSFEISNFFDTPVNLMVTELNVVRTEVLGPSTSSTVAQRVGRP